MRNEQAAETVAFVTKQKEEASAELQKRERALTEFLAKHPEFVADAAGASAEGASIRASRKTAANPNQPYASVKERQLRRIIARLTAPADAPAPTPGPPSPERLAAEQAVKDAQRDVASAQRELEDALSKFTDLHPSAIKAKERLAAANLKLRQAQAAVPPDAEAVIRPATAEDRARLLKEKEQLEAEIRAEQTRAGKTPEPPTENDTEARVVKLETENSELRRNVAEVREPLLRRRTKTLLLFCELAGGVLDLPQHAVLARSV